MYHDSDSADDSVDDWDGDEPIDADNDDADDLRPHCGESIHFDSIRCPHCERYLTDETSDRPIGRWVVITAAVLLLVILFRWVL